MSHAADQSIEDHRIVLIEVTVHLREIGRGELVDVDALARAWMQVHRCDAAVMAALDPWTRQQYQAIVSTPRRAPRRSRSWSGRSTVTTGSAHLRVAVHRRLMVLQVVVNLSVPDMAAVLGRDSFPSAWALGEGA